LQPEAALEGVDFMLRVWLQVGWKLTPATRAGNSAG
jgi:hypothetical protein